MRVYRLSILMVLGVLALQSCQQPGGNNPGSEYMPDMVHSTAFEANLYDYYYYNTWGSEDDYYKYAQPRLPVEGTVSRTSSSTFHLPSAVNSVSYAYGNTEEERARAAQEVLDNPFPITEKGLAKGKELYNIYCGICHGEKADGAGYLVRDDGGKYPAQPANLLLETNASLSNGQYYHAIMYGKNLMGSYADKLNYEERWEVIHYIRTLQAKEFKKEYSAQKNTYDTHATPIALTKAHSTKMAAGDVIEEVIEKVEGHMKGDHSNH